MAFVTASLFFGVLLIGIPIALHLAMRQQPKRQLFPALQFLQSRRQSNQRRMRLRHWILLMLRCLVIAAAAAALARPSVSSALLGNWIMILVLGLVLLFLVLLFVAAILAGRSRFVSAGLGTATACVAVALIVLAAGTVGRGADTLIGDREAPVAAVLVIDTAPRMEYRHSNYTRLEHAEQTADWLLRQLPRDSEVAVVDSRPQPAVFSVDRSAARTAINRLEITAVPRGMVELVRDALDLLTTSQMTRKEIYVFTDMAEQAWRTPSSGDLANRLAEHPDILVYVVDVGVSQPNNFALGDVTLSAEHVARNTPIQIETLVTATGSGGTRNIELLLDEQEPTLPRIRDGEVLLPTARRRSLQTIDLQPGQSQQLTFTLDGLPPGTHQGTIRFDSNDGLPTDDVRYFTLQVHPSWPLLVADAAGGTSRYLVEAVAPYEHRQTDRARFRADVVPAAELTSRTLSDYAAVCLLDPPPLPDQTWEALHAYARSGGGVAIFLGHNAEASSAFNTPVAQRVLPGRLARAWRTSGRDIFFSPRSYDHPMMREFRSLATTVPWNRFPVFRHWQLSPLDDDARVVATYNNGNPAIVERLVGEGRIVVMSTPISDPARPQGRTSWNELPTGEDAWPYLVLINEMMEYLVAGDRGRLNYTAGEASQLENREGYPERYQMFTPSDDAQDVAAHEGRLLVRDTELPGHYRLRGGGGETKLRGFSVNVPYPLTDLRRMERDGLDQRLGSDRYRYARNQEEIELGVGEARVGREFYPLLLLLLAGALALEHLLSNRFYRLRPARVEETEEATVRPATTERFQSEPWPSLARRA